MKDDEGFFIVMAEAHFDSGNTGGSGTGPPDRRRWARVRCPLPAEMRMPGSSFPLQVETTDMSLGGCYVATMFPLPKGTVIDFRCWVAGTPIACKAVVRTTDAGVGNGIEFLDLDELSRATLGAHLDSVAGRDALAQEPIGVIHPRM